MLVQCYQSVILKIIKLSLPLFTLISHLVSPCFVVPGTAIGRMEKKKPHQARVQVSNSYVQLYNDYFCRRSKSLRDLDDLLLCLTEVHKC
jgi:hypothetical protein